MTRKPEYQRALSSAIAAAKRHKEPALVLFAKTGLYASRAGAPDAEVAQAEAETQGWEIISIVAPCEACDTTAAVDSDGLCEKCVKFAQADHGK
jgi:hypothetical protein